MGTLSRTVMAIALTGAASAWAETPDERMTRLEAKIESLEGELQEYRRQATLKQADPAVVAQVMVDAQARSAPLSGGKVGYSSGFFLASEKNDFQLKLNGLLLTRYVYNHNDSSVDDDDENGFQIRRAELYMNGNAFGQKLFFQYSGGFERGSSGFSSITAFAGYQFTKEADLRGGLFKAPFMIEELIAAGRQQAGERSFINTYFSVGTTEGLQGQYSRGEWRAAVMVHDGTNAASTDFNADKTDFGIAARAEWKLAGEWSQLNDFEGWQDTKLAARLGAAIDYESGESGDASINPDCLKYTVDLTVKGRGWNVFLVGAGRHTDDDGSGIGDLNQYGLLAQGGVFVVPNRWELFARHEYLFVDGYFSSTVPAIRSGVNLSTIGMNWFFLGHNAKLTTDVVYVCEPIPVGSTGAGLVASDDGPQWVFRTGFALLF